MYKDKKKKRLYDIWHLMKRRCDDSNTPYYKRYGGRGITYCNKWNSFETFYKWALSNGYDDTLTLDRIDCDGDYEPSNCRWVDMKTQQNNRSSNHLIKYKGVTKTISQWAEEINIPVSTLLYRLENGWTIERAFTEPLNNTKPFNKNEYVSFNAIQDYFKKFLFLLNGDIVSLRKISVNCKIPYCSMKDWKNGKEMITYRNLKALLKYYNVSVNDFLGDYVSVYNSKIFSNTDFILYYIDTNKRFMLNDLNKYLNVKKPYTYLQNIKNMGYNIIIDGRIGRNNIYKLMVDI